MNRTSLCEKTPLLTLLLTISLMTFLTGCGGDGPKDSGATSQEGSQAITMPKVYEGDTGPDANVPPELGGPGFESIAADSGWQDGSIPEEMFQYINASNTKKGGKINGRIGDFPATFRYYGKDGSTTDIQLLNSLVYETLIDVNPITLEFMPILASHWKVGEDQQTYYFRINPEARFSDGYPVTSDDVIATHKLLTDEGILDPFRNQLYGKQYDAPQKISKYIFSVRSKEKNWKNMLYFGGLYILPAHYIGAIDGATYLDKFQYTMPPGSGPYILLDDDVNKGRSITLTRLADYWNRTSPFLSGRYNFDKIKLIAIEDDNLAYEKFRNGETDFFYANRAQWWKTKFDFEEVERGLIQKRKIYNDDPQGIQGFAFNTRREPFSDPRVRKAFTLLFNRAEMIEKIMYNEYNIADSYYPNSVYENPNNPKYRYNPEEAIKLLEEAGYTERNSDGILMKNGKPLRIELPAQKTSAHIMTPVQQDLKQVGIQMDIRYVDFAQQIKLANERNFDLVYLARTGLLYPNPTGSFHSDMADVDNTNNTTGFKNSRADEIIEEELVTFDQKKRIALIRELDSILMEAQPYALTWAAPFQRIVYWNYLDTPEFYINRVEDWRNVYSYWWYDAEKAAIIEKAMDDPSITMDVGDVEVFYWTEFNKKHNTATPAMAGEATASN